MKVTSVSNDLFLKSNHNDIAVFDPTDPEIDQTQFPTDWSTTPYGVRREIAPSNVPAAASVGFVIRAF